MVRRCESVASSVIDPRTFPVFMLALSIGAGIVYLSSGDIRRGFYWLAAALITVTVTF